MASLIYFKNLATGRVLSSQPDPEKPLESRDAVDLWELFEVVAWGSTVVVVTCPAHTHGRHYTVPLAVHGALTPMEGQPPVYVPFVWAG